MFNTSGCNKDFREWSEGIMTPTQERIKKLKEVQRDLQWKYDMELYRLESEITKKKEAIDDLNASLFEMAQMNTDKDKLIKALQTENSMLRETLKDKEYKIHKLQLEIQQQQQLETLEKRVADFEQGKKLFLLDDNSTPIKSFTLTGKLTVMDEPAEEKLEVGKWYHTLDYTVDELRKLLPVGTTIFVEKDVVYDSIDTEPPTRAKICKVKDIIRGNFKFTALIDINEGFLREWFQIAKEN